MNKPRLLLQWMVTILLAIVTILPADAQYGARGDKRYRDRYSRASVYGDMVEIRLREAGTLESKMPPEMVNSVRLLHIEGPMDAKDFKFLKKICDRSRCVDNRGKSVDNYIDLELERVRIMSSGTIGLLGNSGSHDVLDNGLSYSSHLRSIVLPERLKRIGSNALQGCSLLEEVIMPPGVRVLGNSAFRGCTHLEYITMPAGLESIGDECFYDCERLRSIILPRGVIEIGDKAFGNSGLRQVSLPSGLATLGEAPFEGTPLTTLTIPAATRITNDYLGLMPHLLDITVEDGNRYYTWEDGVLFDSTGRALLLYPAGRDGTCVVPNGVESIAHRALAGSASTGIDLPASLHEIGDGAFAASSLVQAVLPPSVTAVGESAFENCSQLRRIDMPGVASMGKRAFKYCRALQAFTVGKNLTEVPQEAFEECKSLEAVILPSSVTAVSLRAFKNCAGLQSVEFSIGLTELDKEAFEGCKGLTSIDLPPALKAIGERAFKNCRGLTRVTLPDACQTVGKEAFRECVAVTQVDLGNGVTSLGDNALRETAITTLVLPRSITHLGKKVAEKCKNLTRIECHATVPPTLEKESNSKIELLVPDTSVEAYRSAKNWKNFKSNIRPIAVEQ